MSSFAAPIADVRDAVARALAEDLGPLGDVTAALVPPDSCAVADVVARAHGVIAGTGCASEVFAQLDSEVRVEWLVDDGGLAGTGAKIGHVAGPLRSVLTGERTALNFLCHLSGVATATHRFVLAAGEQTRILDTRKTLPGLRSLEKAAVRAGGGVNHRSSLSDFVLLKDNHLAGIGITEAVRHAHSMWSGRAVEVECDRIAQVEEAVSAGASMVLLDNMAPDEVRECVALVRASAGATVLVEVSGGVTLENVRSYAGAGADAISTSVITQSAPALDIAFDIAPDIAPDIELGGR
ncbi:MAG: carboxylating nicotinate-nucleotide diphosphorylase [Acidimicrobiia bacterium]